MKEVETIDDIFTQFACRFENEPGELYCLSIIDRTIYPRMWIDSDLATPMQIMEETIEHILLRNNPILQKDWLVRFEAFSMEEIIIQFNDWVKRNNS